MKGLWEMVIYIIIIWAIPSTVLSIILKRKMLKVNQLRCALEEAVIFTGFAVFFIVLLKISLRDELILPALILYFLMTGLIQSSLHKHSVIHSLSHSLISLAAGILVGLVWLILFFVPILAYPFLFTFIFPLAIPGFLWLVTRLFIKIILGFDIKTNLEKELAIFVTVFMVSVVFRWKLLHLTRTLFEDAFWILAFRIPELLIIGTVEFLGVAVFKWYGKIDWKKATLIIVPLYLPLMLSVVVSLIMGMSRGV